MPRENDAKVIKAPNALKDLKILKAFAISC